jgi:phosphoserine phosphatase
MQHLLAKRMTKILLIRHGHVEGITPERFRGRQPLDLTARGHAEARAVARRISCRWQARSIYTSPMRRCVETADAITNLAPTAVHICEDLTDLDYGSWQFKTFQEAKAEDPTLFAAWFATPHLIRFPGGESLQDVAARAADAVRLVLACHHPEDTVVLVSHDSVNRVLLLQFLGLPLASYWRIQQSPCCINEIDINDTQICVLCVNESLHLEQVEEPSADR